jgi:uncharacterized protein (TIGR01777 family)
MTNTTPSRNPAGPAGGKLRIVIPGGSGQVGNVMSRHFHGQGHAVTVLSRHPKPAPWQVLPWNGRDLGAWTQAIDGANVVINLAGRSVNCRYTPANRREIMESRVLSTRMVGQSIAQAARPPALWINASTATIYRHALDRAMDESGGELGGQEADAPSTWRFSIDVATSWEREFFAAATPRTRKVALRSAMTMSTDPGGIFDTLLKLVRAGLGGKAASGKQFISWIHETDFIRAIEFMIAREDLDGCINVCSPSPLPNQDFMRALRQAWGAGIGLPATKWMLEVGAILLRTETELILKSRRVVPRRLLEAGFEFNFAGWPEAADDLVEHWRTSRARA